MPSKGSRHQTFCTACQQWVGAAPNWNRWQNQQVDEWRIARHAAVARIGYSNARRPICKGGGLLVSSAVIFPVEASA